MKKSREEWKKQLDARFQDIERYVINHSEKYKTANSTSPTKPNAPMILSLLSNISSNFKLKKQEKICKTISTPSQKKQLRGSIKRLKKLVN